VGGRGWLLVGGIVAGIVGGAGVVWLHAPATEPVVFNIPVPPVNAVYSNPTYQGALAIDARTGYAAVATTAGVTLLDTHTGTVVRTVPLSQGYAMSLAVDEQRGHVIAIGAGVAVLDARRAAIVRTALASLFPLGIVVDDRSGHAFILDGRAFGGHVVMLDTGTGRVQHTAVVSSEDSAQAGAVDTRTARAFVTSLVDDSVSVLDTQTGAVVATALVARSPCAVAVDERRGRVFVASSGVASGGSGLSVLDARTGTVLRIQPLTTSPLALAVDALTGRVFLVNGPRGAYGAALGISGVSTLDAQSGAILRTVPIPENLNLASIAVDVRRGRVFVSSQGAQDPARPGALMGAGSVYVLDARSGALLRTLPAGVGPVAMVVDDATGHVVVLDAGGTVDVRDGWTWAPGWLRRVVPFLPSGQVSTRPIPSSVRVLDPSQPSQ